MAGSPASLTRVAVESVARVGRVRVDRCDAKGVLAQRGVRVAGDFTKTADPRFRARQRPQSVQPRQRVCLVVEPTIKSGTAPRPILVRHARPSSRWAVAAPPPVRMAQ